MTRSVQTYPQRSAAEPIPRELIANVIADELYRAYAKHGAEQWGRHEFYAILKEEVDELWDAIKRDESHERVIEEVIDVAAMCFRYMETGDRYRAPTASDKRA